MGIYVVRGMRQWKNPSIHLTYHEHRGKSIDIERNEKMTHDFTSKEGRKTSDVIDKSDGHVVIFRVVASQYNRIAT